MSSEDSLALSSSVAVIGDSVPLRSTHIDTLEILASREKEIDSLKFQLDGLTQALTQSRQSLAAINNTSIINDEWEKKYQTLSISAMRDQTKISELKSSLKEITEKENSLSLELSQYKAIAVMREERNKQLEEEMKLLKEELSKIKENENNQQKIAEKTLQNLPTELPAPSSTIDFDSEWASKPASPEQKMIEPVIVSEPVSMIESEEKTEQSEIVDVIIADLPPIEISPLIVSQSKLSSKNNSRTSSKINSKSSSKSSTKPPSREQLKIISPSEETSNSSEPNTPPSMKRLIEELKLQVKELQSQLNRANRRSSQSSSRLSSRQSQSSSPAIITIEPSILSYSEEKDLLQQTTEIKTPTTSNRLMAELAQSKTQLSTVQLQIEEMKSIIENKDDNSISLVSTVKLPKLSSSLHSTHYHRSSCTALNKLENENKKLQIDKELLIKQITRFDKHRQQIIKQSTILPQSLANVMGIKSF